MLNEYYEEKRESSLAATTTRAIPRVNLTIQLYSVIATPSKTKESISSQLTTPITSTRKHRQSSHKRESIGHDSGLPNSAYSSGLLSVAGSAAQMGPALHPAKGPMHTGEGIVGLGSFEPRENNSSRRWLKLDAHAGQNEGAEDEEEGSIAQVLPV